MTKPWEPQKDKRGVESMPAFAAFAEYRDMGSERSIEAVAKKLGKSEGLLERWSSRWSWVSRAQSYDAHLDSIQTRSRERALENDAEEWARTQRDVAKKLIDKSNLMLDFPLAKQKSQDGKTIVEPARWSFGDAAKLSDTGIKLGRLARGESTENVMTVEQKRAKLAETLGIPLAEVYVEDGTKHVT